MNSVQVKVAEQITGLSPQVEDKVVGVLVGRELTRRSDALVKVMDAHEKLGKDMQRLKPDQISYNEKGEKVAETFSKSKLDERAKLQKNIDKHANAINKALEKAEFGDVYNLSQGKPTSDEQQDTAGKSEDADS